MLNSRSKLFVILFFLKISPSLLILYQNLNYLCSHDSLSLGDKCAFGTAAIFPLAVALVAFKRGNHAVISASGAFGRALILFGRSQEQRLWQRGYKRARRRGRRRRAAASTSARRVSSHREHMLHN